MNVKVAVVGLVGFAGGLVIVTTGAVVSMTHVYEAEPGLPTASVRAR